MNSINPIIESIRANWPTSLALLLGFLVLVAFFLLDPGSVWGRRETKILEHPTPLPTTIEPSSKNPPIVDLTEISEKFSLWEEARFGLGTDTVVIRSSLTEE